MGKKSRGSFCLAIFGFGLLLWFFSPLQPFAAPEVISDGDFVAYSLRESEQLAKSKKTSVDGMLNLGGMTRIVGMVHDASNRDVIIVGKRVHGLPQASLDDLVVALRSRLVYAVWPMASIDPTEDTSKSRLQSVRLRGGVENTQFGQQFLDCDVILKKYSLGMLARTQQIASYKELCDRYINAELVERGGRVAQVTWQSAAEAGKTIQKFQKREIKAEKSLQCRFWFYPLDSSEVTELEGLLVIPELHLGVKKEVTGGTRPGQLDKDREGQDKAADDFSTQFTTYLSAAESKYGVLKTMRLLYSMVTVAEGIGHLKNRPSFEYFLHDYQIKKVETPKTYDLHEILGVFHQSDGVDYIVKISGGIELKAIMTSLNGGDVAPLKDAVIQSRPDPAALFWRVPVRGWQLSPEDRQQSELEQKSALLRNEHPASSPDRIGCSLETQAYLLGPATVGDTDNRKGFVGFTPPSPFAAPTVVGPIIQYVSAMRPPGGVDMTVEPVSTGRGGSKLREKLMNFRPSGDDLSWPVETPKKSQ